MIKYAIVDDEPIAHRIIEGYAKDLLQLEKAGNCYDAFEAITLLQKEKVDLLFLDINMPRFSGFDFLKSIPQPPKVIVTSAYKEYALEGYELDVCDYLLKPFSFERFIKAVNKVSIEAKAPEQAPSLPNQARQIFIKGDKKLHQIYFHEIIYVEAFGNYCKVILDDEVIVTLQKISDFEKKLPADFIRVHKSFIISKEKIRRIEGNRIYFKDHQVPIGQTYRSVVKKLYVV